MFLGWSRILLHVGGGGEGGKGGRGEGGKGGKEGRGEGGKEGRGEGGKEGRGEGGKRGGVVWKNSALFLFILLISFCNMYSFIKK